MPTPSVFTRSRNWRQEGVQAGGEDLVDAAVLQVGAQPAGPAQRLARLLVGHHAAGWPPPRACRRPASAACRGAGSAARPPSRAGSRCGRPCGRPRSPRPSAGSPTSDRSRTPASLPPLPLAAPVPKNSLSTAWNFTSSRRAVLSARSRKLPMRRKWKASSCSMVPTVTPRDRCERNLTHSKSVARVALRRPLSRSMRWNSSQVWFCVSQTSVVSVPRTARAFSRAAIRQERMLDGLLRVAHHVVHHLARRRPSPWRLAKSPRQLGDAEQALPALLGRVGRLRQQRGLVVDVEHARGVLGALHVAGHPEEVVGGS